MTPMLAVTARERIADYVEALVTVYWIILIAYILFGWLDMLGARISYNRPIRMIRDFVSDASEPYLRIFRRLLPPFGGFDLSPIIAILVLYFVGGLVAEIIRG